MPQYLLFLRADEVPEMTPEESAQHLADFVAWSEKLVADGHLVGVERLESDIGGVLRQRGGEVVLDGPFTEARELVLGYFAIQATDYDEAVTVARTCPSLKVGGSVEVRQIGEFPKPADL